MNGTKRVVVGGMEREAVEIEGQWWVESGSDMVQFFPQSKTVLGVEFVEEKEYPNSYGTYVVRYIRPDGTMDVEYVSAKRAGVSVGTRATYPMKAQAQAILGEKRRLEVRAEKAGYVELNGEVKSFADWLRKGCVIGMHLPGHVREQFVADYVAVTGEKPDEKYMREDNVYWGKGLYVEFPEVPQGLNVSVPSKLKVLSGNGRPRIWNKDFVMGLIRAGFRLGRNGQMVA